MDEFSPEAVTETSFARQGLTVAAIARRTGHDRKTIRKYIARGLEPPAYKPAPRAPRWSSPSRLTCESGWNASPS